MAAIGHGDTELNPAFVGRVRELQILKKKLDRAFAGRGSLVMLTGEAGIGKTWVAQRFARSARQQGAVVLSGCCFEGDWQPPYGPWLQSLGEYVRTTAPEQLRRELGPNASPLAHLMPGLRTALPDLPDPPSLSPDEERFRLYEAVIQWLFTMAKEKPILLVLDDLHWADLDSLRLLRYLARFVDRAPVLVVGAHRDSEQELNDRQQMAEVLAVLQRETGYERVPVRGLTTADVAEYLALSTGQDLPQGLARTVQSVTSGNPFFVHEILRHLIEDGRLPREGGLLSTELGIGSMGTPAAVRQVVQRRLARVSKETSDMLRLATGFGGGFAFQVLAALTDLPDDMLLNCLDEALEAGLLRATDGAPPMYDFAHTIVRHALYDQQNPDRRARLHRRIALALEQSYAGRLADHAAELAAQYHASADLPGAAAGIPYALDAAEQAKVACAHERAALFLRIAHALSAESESAVRAKILCKLAVAEAEALMLEDSRRSVEDALALLAASEVEPRARAEFLAAVARVWQDGGAGSSLCDALVERGLALVGEERDLLWARLALLRDRFEPVSIGIVNAGRWLGYDPRAVEIVRARGNEDDYAQTLEPFARRTRQQTESILTLARNWQRPMAILRALQVVVRDLIYRHGAFHEAAERCQELLEASERYGSLFGQAEALVSLAGAQVAIGELQPAQHTAQRAFEITARLGSGQALRYIEIGLESVLAYYLDGDWTALASAATELATSQELVHSLVGPGVAATAAFDHSRAGNSAEAYHILAALTPVAERVEPTTYGHNLVVALASSAVWDLAAREYADIYRRQARAAIEAGVGGTVVGPHELSIARMATLLGDMSEAGQYFARARRTLDAHEQHHLRAIVDYDEALALIRTHSTERTRVLALLEAAMATFARLSMEGWVKRALSQQEALLAAGPGAHVADHDYPDGLTAREVEVLRLLANGNTNREIAVALIVSLPTVQRHIVNIYAKINARGRADATAYALRRGIVEPRKY